MFDATGTIGGRPCEISLGNILAERNDPKLIYKVVKYLQTAKRRIKTLQQIDDETKEKRLDKEFLISMLKKYYKQKITCDHKINDHMMCCINAYFKAKDGN